MEESHLGDGEIFMKPGTPGPALNRHAEMHKKDVFVQGLTGRPVSGRPGPTGPGPPGPRAQGWGVA